MTNQLKSSYGRCKKKASGRGCTAPKRCVLDRRSNRCRKRSKSPQRKSKAPTRGYKGVIMSKAMANSSVIDGKLGPSWVKTLRGVPGRTKVDKLHNVKNVLELCLAKKVPLVNEKNPSKFVSYSTLRQKCVHGKGSSRAASRHTSSRSAAASKIAAAAKARRAKANKGALAAFGERMPSSMILTGMSVPQQQQHYANTAPWAKSTLGPRSYAVGQNDFQPYLNSPLTQEQFNAISNANWNYWEPKNPGPNNPLVRASSSGRRTRASPKKRAPAKRTRTSSYGTKGLFFFR